MNNHTILGQILQIIPRFEFEKLVKETKSEYHARGFTSWNHFGSLLFGQLAGQDSLRTIQTGLATQSPSLYHLGIKPVPRSTLSYANENRPADLFAQIFYCMLSKCQSIAPRHKFRFKNPLYSIDATVIQLCLSMFDWAKFQVSKGAIKLHVKLNHSGYLPTFMVMTTGNDHEAKVAPFIPLEKGAVAVFDKAYIKYGWLASLDNTGVFFVTRLKENAAYRVVKSRDVSNYPNISSDQTIKLIRRLSKLKYPQELRRIRCSDPKTGKSIVLLTNNFNWSANTISRIYKDRWQIELFFKAIKQLLKIKSFLGTTPNAMLSQLWVALTAYLLLSYLKFRSKSHLSLYSICMMLPLNLFARRNLWSWFDDPYHAAVKVQPTSQLTLGFG